MKKRNTKNTFLESAGWIGVILIISSYGLLAFGVVDSDSLLYHSLVLVGAFSVAVLSYKKHDLQPAVLNGVFSALALVAIARILLA